MCVFQSKKKKIYLFVFLESQNRPCLINLKMKTQEIHPSLINFRCIDVYINQSFTGLEIAFGLAMEPQKIP